MLWLVLACTQFLTISCTFYYYYKKDKHLAVTGTWDKYKLYPYTIDVWLQWREPGMKSVENSLYNILVTFILCKHFSFIFEPNINNTILRLMLYYFSSETYFFFIHKLLHKFLTIHSFHHRNVNSTVASFYDSVTIEHIFLNIGAIFVPLFLVHLTPLEFIVVYNASIYFVCVSHGGYKNRSLKHFLHHKLYTKNYGFGLYIWDRVFGSYV